MRSSHKAGTGLPIVLAVFDILVLDEFHKNERRIVPGALSRKLSTGIWHGTEILREYLSGRITAAPLSVVVRTDILRCNNCFSSGISAPATSHLVPSAA